MRPLVAITALLLLAGSAQAQVYKCKGKSGESVYSQDPCDAAAKPMALRGSRAATLSDAETQRRQAMFKSTDLTDAGIAERSCLSNADKSIYRLSNTAIASHERQIAALNTQLAALNTTLADATAANGLHTQISGLQQAITAERSSADTQMQAARERCAASRRRQEEQIEQRYTAPANGP